MKCVKKSRKILRVGNEEAAELVSKEGYEYTSKSEWKRFRDGEDE